MNKPRIVQSKGNTFYIKDRGIPKGCQQCLNGVKTVLFINGTCQKPPNCSWYCPISEERRDTVNVFANEIKISSKEEVLDEINKIRGKGTWQRIFNNYSEDHRIMLTCCLRKNTANQIQTVIDDWIDTSVFGVSFFFITPPKDNSDITVLNEERKYAKNELHRAVDEYPNFLRMTHSLVDLIYDTNKDECPVFRFAKWYDYQGNLVNHCLLGKNADCSLCGCITPLYLRMVSKWWKYLNKRMIDILTLPRDIKQCREPGEK